MKLYSITLLMFLFVSCKQGKNEMQRINELVEEKKTTVYSDEYCTIKKITIDSTEYLILTPIGGGSQFMMKK